MTARIAGKVIKQLLKKLIISGIIIGLCILVMQINLAIGIILMMLYSSFMVMKSSGKEMPLNAFTALLPGIMSLVTFFIMLGLIGVHNEEMPLIGLGLGIVPGWLMARGHKVYKKNGTVYAKRTFFYVFVWVLSLLFTQGSTLAGMREITDFAFLLNGFSTAMMVVLSVVLFMKTYKKQDKIQTVSNNIIGLLLPILFLFLIIPPETQAKSQFTIQGKGSYTMDQIFDYIFKEEYLQLLGRNAKRNTRAHYDRQRTDSFYNDKANVIFTIEYFDDNAELNRKLQDKIEYYNRLYKKFKNSISKWPVNMPNGHTRYVQANNYITKYNSLSSAGRGMAYSYIATSNLVTKQRPKKYITAGGGAVWQYKQWLFNLDIEDHPYLVDSLLGLSYEKYIKNAIRGIQSRIKNVRLIDASAFATNSQSTSVSPSASQSQSSPNFSDTLSELTSKKHLEALGFDNVMNNDDGNDPQDNLSFHKNHDLLNKNNKHTNNQSGQYFIPNDKGLLAEIKKALRDFGFKNDDASAAGVAVALLMLLGGMGMNAALTAAQETANAVMAAAQEGATAGAMAGGSSDAADDNNYGYDSRTHSNGTLMLDGDEARDWMKDNGYLDDNGKPNEKYTEFMNAMDSDSIKQGLRGFAGDLDDDGNPTGDYVIIVDDDAPAVPVEDKETPQETDDSDTDKTPDDYIKDDGGDGEEDGGDEGTGEDEVVVGPPIDYLIQVKEEEIRLQEEDIRKKEQDLKNLDSDIKKLKKEKEITSEVEFQNSIINLFDFAFGTFANISAPSWALHFKKSFLETFVRYNKTGDLPGYEDFKKFLKKQAKEYIDEKSGAKIKSSEDIWGEAWDTLCSGAYSKLKEFDDSNEHQKQLSNQLESRRTQYSTDKNKIEKLKEKREENKHQLDLLRIKRGDIP